MQFGEIYPLHNRRAYLCHSHAPTHPCIDTSNHCSQRQICPTSTTQLQIHPTTTQYKIPTSRTATPYTHTPLHTPHNCHHIHPPLLNCTHNPMHTPHIQTHTQCGLVWSLQGLLLCLINIESAPNEKGTVK